MNDPMAEEEARLAWKGDRFSIVEADEGYYVIQVSPFKWLTDALCCADAMAEYLRLIQPASGAAEG